MSNEMKLLKAFIEASGYDVEEVKTQVRMYSVDEIDNNGNPYTSANPTFINNTEYKLTKKVPVAIPPINKEKQEDKLTYARHCIICGKGSYIANSNFCANLKCRGRLV
jgi:S-adenosylmethionine hydrolase